MISRVKEFFKNMSLMKKSTLVYSLIIMIPAIIIGLYTYSGLQNSMRDEIRSRLQKNVYQITDDINSRTNNVKSVGNIIVNDKKIRYFMDLSRILDGRNETLYYSYVDSTYPLLTNAMYFHSFDLFKISIYINSVNKADMVERRGIIFSDDRIQKFDWYKNLEKSNEEFIWLPSHMSKLYTPYSGGGDTLIFTLVQKISNTNGDYLGVAVLDVRRDDVLSSVINFNREESDNIVFVTDKDHNIILSPGQIDRQKEIGLCREYIKNDSGYFFIGEDFYVYEYVDVLGINIVCKADMQEFMGRLQSTAMNIILIFLAGLIILIGLTYLSMKTIFKRLRQIVNTMNSVARGKFDVRIPIDRKDEVGQLAEDFNILIEKIDDLVKSILEKEVAQKDAQLLALQYQINPHFIYNMIDNFRMRMIILKDYQTAEALTDFGKILRYNISNQSKYSTINDELDNVRKYISLQRFKYQDRITLTVHLPEELKWLRVIKFILQPVVENCIKHGLVDRKQIMEIGINITRNGDVIKISIRDNGAGIDPENLEKINHILKYSQYADNNIQEAGIGLSNINNRLKLYYGNQYHIKVNSIYGEYTEIEIVIPYEFHGEDLCIN